MSAPPLRRWSELSPEEQETLLAAYQATMDPAATTCDLSTKIARMNAFLNPRGVTLSEEDLRRPRR